MNFFLQGIALGFAIAAPVGPIAILCIRHTLARGWQLGLVAGLGAATADAVYGCMAGLGLTLVSPFLIDQQSWLRLIGGAFLCYLGVKTFTSPPAKAAVNIAGTNLASVYGTTFVLTLANPATILSFAAVFTSLGAASPANAVTAMVLVMGVFAGSACWWLLLSGSIAIVRRHFTPLALLWINRLSGAVILTFGLLALASQLD